MPIAQLAAKVFVRTAPQVKNLTTSPRHQVRLPMVQVSLYKSRPGSK